MGHNITATHLEKASKADNPLKTLSDRLRYALQRRDVRKADLARKIAVKHQVIQYLCSRNVKHSKFAYHIAEALNINPDWLIAGEGPFETTHLNSPIENTAIPLLTPPQFPQLLDTTAKLQTEQVIYGDNDFDNPFALQMRDKSMYPRLEEGTLLIFERDTIPQHGGYVLAHLNDTQDFVIRQMEINGEETVLAPLNIKTYRDITLSKKDQILGVLKEIRMRTK